MTTTPPIGAPGSGNVRARLQVALRAAMKARDTVAVSALRSTLAAIANAEAIAPPTASAAAADQYVAGSTAGLAAAEAERREVTDEDAAGIAQAEAAERRAAARQYQDAGQADRAERLLREAQVIEELCLESSQRFFGRHFGERE
jgi:uncharacterized protein